MLRGVIVLGIFGVSESRDWQFDGRRVFDQLQLFTMSVHGLRQSLDPPPDAVFVPDPEGANQQARAAHDEFYGALQEWTKKHAPGSRNTGRKDPSRGGFPALSTSLQDSYRAITMSYLATLGLTSYLDAVTEDGRLSDVQQAVEVAPHWYNAAGEFAASLVKTGEPRNARFIAAYAEQVHTPFRAASVLYDGVVPYLDSLGNR